MRTRHYLVILLVGALGGATALAWMQWRELTVLRAGELGREDRAALEAQLASLRDRNRALLAELAAMQSGFPAGEEEEATEDGEPGESGDQALFRRLAALASADGDIGSRRDGDLELLAALADVPEFQRMLALHQRGRVEQKYADLFKKLPLSPGELARLQTLLGDRQGAFADAMMAARAQGLTGREARELASRVARGTQREITDSIKEMLGPQRFNQLQTYERTEPQREIAGQLAERLSYTTEPLTPRQQERLVQTLSNADLRKTSKTAAGQAATKVKPPPAASVAALPGSVTALDLGNGASIAITSEALARAASFLSSSQVAALKRMQQEQQAQETIGNLLRSGTVAAPAKEAKAAKPGKVARPGK